MCRAHNRFGWGDFGAVWTFRVAFRPGVEETQSPGKSQLAGRTIWQLKSGKIELDAGSEAVVYNAAGEKVRVLKANGQERIFWDLRDENGNRVQAGMYFLKTGPGLAGAVRKLILLK
jgi:hypothetical protein